MKYKFLSCLLMEHAIGLAVEMIPLPFKGNIITTKEFIMVSHRENGIEIVPMNDEYTRKAIIPIERAYFKNKKDKPKSEPMVEHWTAGQLLLENVDTITDQIDKKIKEIESISARDIMNEIDDILDKAADYEFEMMFGG